VAKGEGVDSGANTGIVVEEEDMVGAYVDGSLSEVQ